MQQSEHATAPKHGNKIHGRDPFMMLNKRWTPSYSQFIHYQVQTSMAKMQLVNRSQTWWNEHLSGISEQVAHFGAWKLYATEPEHGKVKHGMELIKELNKSHLVTLSQKGSENTITSMWTWQKLKQITDLVKNWSMQNRYQVGMFTSSMHSLQSKAWQSKHTPIKNTHYTS